MIKGITKKKEFCWIINREESCRGEREELKEILAMGELAKESGLETHMGWPNHPQGAVGVAKTTHK